MLDNIFMDPFAEDQDIQTDPPGSKKKTEQKPQGPPINLYTPQVNIQYGTTSPGANMSAEDKNVPLYETNINWLSTMVKKMDENDLEYAKTLFTVLNTLPTIDNKPVSLSELSTVMADPKKSKAIMDQAYKLDDNPELDPETKWSLIENHYKNVMLGSLVMEGNNRISEDLYQAAKIRDAKKENIYFKYTSLFDGKKQFISESQWELKQVQKLTEDYNNEVLAYNIRNYKPSSVMQAFYKAKRQEAGIPESISAQESKPMVPINLPNSRLNFNKFKQDQLQEAQKQLQYGAGVLEIPTAQNYTKGPFYGKVKGMYGKAIQAVRDQYNSNYDPANLGPNSPRKLRADVEGKFTGNKGGEFHSPIMTMGFDFNNPFVIADEIVEDKNTGEVKLNRNSQIMDEGVKEAAGLFKYVQTSPTNVIYNVGAVQESVPSDSWERGPEAVQAIITELMANHKKGNKLIPRGSITFQGIVQGEEKYHAYHVKMDPNFFGHRNFSGKGKIGKTDDDEPNKELINNGFTVYIPADESVKNLGMGKKYKSASTISPAEGMMNWKNEVDINIEEGGRLRMIKDPKTGEITMDSYGVILNPNTRSFSDTIRINLQNNKFGADGATDLDAILKRNLEVIKLNWFNNQKQKRLLSTPGSIGGQQ